MDYQLTELIEQKIYEELSESEKSFVLKHLSEEEYRKRSELISKVKSELNSEGKELKANEHIRANVLEALQSKQKKKESRVIPMLFNYKVPLWASVAAIFLVFILTTPLLFNTEIDKLEGTEKLTMRDTVYIEKIVRDTIEIKQTADTVIKTVYATDNSNSFVYLNEELPIYSLKKNKSSRNELDLVVTREDYINPINLDKPSSGKSLSDDPFGRIVLGIKDKRQD